MIRTGFENWWITFVSRNRKQAYHIIISYLFLWQELRVLLHRIVSKWIRGIRTYCLLSTSKPSVGCHIACTDHYQPKKTKHNFMEESYPSWKMLCVLQMVSQVFQIKTFLSHTSFSTVNDVQQKSQTLASRRRFFTAFLRSTSRLISVGKTPASASGPGRSAITYIINNDNNRFLMWYTFIYIIAPSLIPITTYGLPLLNLVLNTPNKYIHYVESIWVTKVF